MCDDVICFPELAPNKSAPENYLEIFMNHICQCKECRNVIVRVVEAVLGNLDDEELLSDTEEYEDSEEDDDVSPLRDSRAPVKPSN